MTADLFALADAAAQRYGIDRNLVRRVLQTESGGRPGLTSPKGAIGPMQLMPGTARDLGVNPHDVGQNIDGGVRYLKQQLDSFGTPELAVAAYNAGPGAVRKYGGVPPYAETQAYVRKTAGGDVDGFDGSDIFGMSSGGDQHPAAAPSDDFDGSDIFKVAAAAPPPKPPPAPVKPPQKGAPKVSVARDVADNAAAGLQEGVAGFANTGADLGALARGITGFASRKMGGPGADLSTLGGPMGPLQIGRMASDAAGGVAQLLGIDPRRAKSVLGAINPAMGFAQGVNGGSSQDAVMAARRDAPLPVPQTTAGRFARTAGQFAPAALTPGSVVQRAKSVILPTLGAEGAAGVTKAAGGDENAQNIARTLGGIGGGIASGIEVNPKRGNAPAQPRAKGLDEMEAEKRGWYEMADNSGFRFKNGDLKAVANDITAELRTRGGPQAAKAFPTAETMLGRLNALARQKDGVSLTQLDLLRRDIYDTMVAPGDKEAFIGKLMRSKIDELTANSNAPYIKEARAANMRWEKAAEIDRKTRSAELRADSSYSGQNEQNAVRQKLRPLIDPDSPQEVTNYTPDERAAVERVVRGDASQNRLRKIEKGLRNPFITSPISTAAGAVGFGLGGPPGAAVAGLGTMGGLHMIGEAVRRSAQKRTDQALKELTDLISTGGVKAPKPPPLLSYSPKRGLIGGTAAAMLSAVPAAAQASQKKKKPERNGKPTKGR